MHLHEEVNKMGAYHHVVSFFYAEVGLDTGREKGAKPLTGLESICACLRVEMGGLVPVSLLCIIQCPVGV